ncbi:conjugative transposon protein TraM [Daejeonella oryzae]|uniref:conjugative transposon protein TraM n=1 Tax=Daejeonella oryzae TaxID=1122943 RepID=UPI0004024777|nr:conjugative transposon protein TraM [Daejeonella oryzae]
METKFKDKRKVLLVLPLLILPFLALAFYAMGGDRSDASPMQGQNQKGINTNLPDAAFKTAKPQDKLAYYQQAERDSAKHSGNEIKTVADRLGFSSTVQSTQTELIDQRLEDLNREINRPEEVEVPRQFTSNRNSGQSIKIKDDVDRLEALMRNMQQSPAEDPEITQLNEMLEKILDIQHPQRLEEKYNKDITQSKDNWFKAIPAIIEENQKVTQGSVIKLRVMDSVLLNGTTIPKDHLIFGISEITNQRLILDIKNIRIGNSIVPVDLSVFDMDGMKGINVPEAYMKNAGNKTANQVIKSLQLPGYDSSVAGQVADAGINAAKGLLSGKTQRVKARLKAGYIVLLRNNKLVTNQHH